MNTSDGSADYFCGFTFEEGMGMITGMALSKYKSGSARYIGTDLSLLLYDISVIEEITNNKRKGFAIPYELASEKIV